MTTTKYTNVTIDNVNPAITYSPWTEWSEGAEPGYSSGTFTTTSTIGSTATFSFYGTAVWVYGARGPTHGNYSVTFDYGNTYIIPGYKPETMYNENLFKAPSEDPGFHTVVITNTGSGELNPDFNIDSIIYRVETPNEVISTQQDTDPAFSYSGTWSNNPDNLSSYNSGTGHSTSDKTGSVNFKFQGTSVQIFGAVGPQNGGYSVQIDGGQPKSYNATKSKFYPQVLLFQQTGGLTSGTHTVTLTNQPYVDGQQLSIDFANSANPPTPSGSSPGSSSGSGLSGGAIGGIVAGVLIVAIIGALFFYFDRRRRNSREIVDLTNEHPGGDQMPDFSPYPYTETNHSQASQTQVNLTGTSPTHNTIPSPPATQQMYQLHSGPNTDTSPVQASGSTPSFHGGSNGTSSSGQNRSNAKAPRLLPATAFESAPNVSRSELIRMRATEENRPQDFGSVISSGTDLPPSYNQATEPFPLASR